MKNDHDSSAFAGSSNPQYSRFTSGGVTGHLSRASPHRVTTSVAL